MVAAIAFESLVKLLAFLAVGVFVIWGLYDGLGDSGRAGAWRCPSCAPADAGPGQRAFAYETVVRADAAVDAVGVLPAAPVPDDGRRERRRAAPAARGLGVPAVPAADQPVRAADRAGRAAALRPRPGRRRELRAVAAAGARASMALALFVFIGGLSAATGMVIVEAIAVSTMVCNDLVMPCCCATRRFGRRGAAWRPDALPAQHPPRRDRRDPAARLALLPPGRRGLRAGQHRPDQLCRGGAVRAGAARRHVLEGRHARRRAGRAAVRLRAVGLHADAALAGQVGLAGRPTSSSTGRSASSCCGPKRCSGLRGLDYLTHSLFWSLLANIARLCRRVAVARSRRPARPARRCSSSMSSSAAAAARPVFWRGRAQVGRPAAAARPLPRRDAGAARCSRTMRGSTAWRGIAQLQPDAQLVQFVETQLAGAIGSASARVMVASVAEEESLNLDDVMLILDEASQLRAYAHALEDKSQLAGTRHRRAARRQRAAEEPGPAQGRLHVLGDARAAHAADLDPRADRADARRRRHGRPRCASSSWASSSPRPSA